MNYYVIRDCQFDCRFFAEGTIFTDKEDIAEQLIDFHSIDFSGTDDKDNELDIYEYLDFWKIKDRLAWVLEYGQWSVINAKDIYSDKEIKERLEENKIKKDLI